MSKGQMPKRNACQSAASPYPPSSSHARLASHLLHVFGYFLWLLPAPFTELAIRAEIVVPANVSVCSIAYIRPFARCQAAQRERFFLRPLFPELPSPSEMIFYVHGVAFTAWIVLLVVQASLVAGGRTELHRKIGPFSAALAGAMVVLGTLRALIAARRDTGFFGITIPPLQFLAVPIFDMLLFATFVSLAIAQRRNPQSHKRWMLLATVNLVTAAIARWPGVLPLAPLAFFGLTDS